MLQSKGQFTIGHNIVLWWLQLNICLKHWLQERVENTKWVIRNL